MQRLTIEVKEEFMKEVMQFIEAAKGNIVVKKDKNLELDPYYYERKKRLEKIREEIKSGKAELLTEEEYNAEIEQFFDTLEKQHAN